VCEQGGKPTITDRYGSNNVLPKPDTVLGGHNDVAILSENSTTVNGARVSVKQQHYSHYLSASLNCISILFTYAAQ
jgi:hypothetical protein